MMGGWEDRIDGVLEELTAQRERAEKAEAEVERRLKQRDEGTLELLAENERHAATHAEVVRLRAAIKALVEAGNRLAEDEDPIDPALEAWAEAKRAALRGGE